MDLEHRRCSEKLPDDPLFNRVLSDGERHWMRTLAPEDLWPVPAWALWASKEACFKVLCKLPGGPRSFHHRGYVCQLEVIRDDGSSAVRVQGTVQGPDGAPLVDVEGRSDLRYLHVVARSGSKAEVGMLETGLEGASPEEMAGEFSDLESRFTPEEWKGVHSQPSARVRILARERIRSHLRSAVSVEILTSGDRPGRAPPRIRVSGRDRPDLDISLSHHGRYVAWAIFIPRGFSSNQ